MRDAEYVERDTESEGLMVIVPLCTEFCVKGIVELSVTKTLAKSVAPDCDDVMAYEKVLDVVSRFPTALLVMELYTMKL